MTPADLAAAIAAALAPVLEAHRAAVREELRAVLSEARQAAPSWQTVRQWSAEHGIATCTTLARIHDGRLPAERVGRHWRIRSDATVAPPAPADRPADRVARLLASSRPLRAVGGGR